MTERAVLQTIESSVAQSSTQKTVFHLGNVVFTVRNCDVAYLEAMEKIIPHYRGDDSNSIQEINTGCAKEVLELIHHVAMLHQKQQCVSIEGSCLIAPNGRKVLLAGNARSGKSTTTMALANHEGWKVFAEYVCMIDYKKNQLLKFLAPAALDEKAVELLKTFDATPKQTFSIEWRKDRVWSPIEDLAENAVLEPSFDVAVWLQRDNQPTSEFSVAQISAAEYARKIMAVSNLLKVKNSFDSFFESMAATQCLTITEGELDQRLKCITSALAQ
jgi:hypothetical protein